MQAHIVTQRCADLEPQRRSYWVQGTTTTEAAIRSNGVADLYAVIGEGNGAEGWVVRLYQQGRGASHGHGRFALIGRPAAEGGRTEAAGGGGNGASLIEAK